MQLSPDHLAEPESLAIQAATRAGEMIQSKTELDHQVLRKQSGSSLASQVVAALDLESPRLTLETLKDSLSTPPDTPRASLLFHQRNFWPASIGSPIFTPLS